MGTVSGKRRVVFWIQPTASFPDGAPQREEYDSDFGHDLACFNYAQEWREEYDCIGCRNNPDCPVHGHEYGWRKRERRTHR